MNETTNHPSSDLIQAYLDQYLDQDTYDRIEKHLEECPTCQAEINQLNMLITKLDNLPELKTSRDYSSLVLTKLREDKHISSGITWTLVVEALAAGTVIGFLVPVLQAAAWLPSLLITKQELQVAINIFFTQLASTWIIWWANIQLKLKTDFNYLLSQTRSISALPSPWVVVLAAGILGILINYLLLRANPLNNHNDHL